VVNFGGGAPAVTSPVPGTVWESLVRSDPGALVSQSLAWRDAVFADGQYRDVSRLYEFSSGEQVAVPLARPRWLPPRAAMAASWPRDWGVGGPICEGGKIGPAQAAAILADLARHGTLGVQIRLRHGAASAWLSEARQFQVEESGCHVLDLGGGFSGVWQHSFRGTARTAVRKAERSGLDVEVDRSARLLPVFWDLYEKSIERWSAKQHEPLRLTRWRTVRSTPPRMLAAVARQFGEDCGIWVARSGGAPVAAIIVLRSGAYAKYWRGAMDRDLATPVRANEYLHRLAIEEACRDGYRFYDMGRSRPESPLAGFKEKFGATQRLGHTLLAERLPIRYATRLSRDTVKRVIGFRDA
jgi:Acetyltransferase (GNAT) domain